VGFLMIFVDAHVHIHDCFDLGSFFENAHRNLCSGAEVQSPSNFSGVLMLAESRYAGWFCSLASKAGKNENPSGEGPRPWSVSATGEESSLSICHPDGRRLFLISGRQVVTQENLEVLALFVTAGIEDGHPIREVLQQVESLGGLAVVPWGAGKWLGKRGELVRRMVQESDGQAFCLGDIRGRPRLSTAPKVFASAQQKGIKILRGTDPLNFLREQCHVGSYGFSIASTLNPTFPAEHLKSLIRSPATDLQPFGRQIGVFPFIRNQIRLRYRKSHGHSS
jgi:hypothetical protein